MKKTNHLIRLAQTLSVKYAEAQTLQEIIENAAGYGEQSTNGIMNFPAQLQKDDAELTIAITINSNPFGGKKIYVGAPSVDPSEAAVNYTKLPEQIKKYLDRNLQYFPQIGLGTILLEYPTTPPPDNSDEEQVAGR